MRLKTVILLACLCVLTVSAQLASAQLGPAIGNITTSGATCSTTSPSANCVTLKLDGSTGAATILITGTFVGTGQFEVSNDGLTTWTNINCTPPNSTTAASSATSTGSWQCNVAGWEHIRVRASAFASGTMSVVINGAHASAKSGGGTSLPALSDNGTNVTSTEAFLAPDGTNSLPAYSFASDPDTGMLSGGANQLAFAVGTVNSFVINSSNQVQVRSTSQYGFASGTTIPASTDLAIGRVGAASIRVGLANGATPIAQTLTVGESSRGGTDSNVAGAAGVIQAGIGTGTGAGAKLCIKRNLMGASGSTAQTQADGMCVGETKTLSNTSATAQAIAQIALASNAGGGAAGTFTLVCTDGTNFDSETQSFTVSFVNKAGAVTVGTPAITASTAANNSGSCTLGITAVANGNNIDLKVTPVFGTIVPSTVTLYPVITHSTGNVTIN